MKLVVVIQRVRDCNVSSPSRQKPSRQVGSGPACVIVRRGMEPGAASMQAVLLSPEICIVVVSRINSGTREEKPTRSMQRKAAVLKAIRRADRIVQRAVVMILEAIFEQVFYSFSHGFRRGHSQRQALLELRKQYRKLNIKWIVDADVSGFFDNIAHDLLRDFINQRVKDGGILRLIGKWLNAGVLEAGELTHPEKGTPQGGVISPMPANIFLHYVLDEWCVKVVKPRIKGKSFLIRFADDFIIGFDLKTDALRVWNRRVKARG